MSKKDFFKKLRNAEEAFEEGRKGRTGGFIEVEDGKYVVRAASMDLDVNDDGYPYVHFKCVVVHSEHGDDDIGKLIQHRVVIKHMEGETVRNGKKVKWEITEKDQFADIATALQSFGFDTADMELTDLAEAAEEIAENHPACRVTIGTNKKGYKYVKWGKYIEEDDSFPSFDDVVEDDDDDDGDENKDEDDDDDNEDSDDDDSDSDDDDSSTDLFDGDIEPEKGDAVEAKPKGTKKADSYIVKTVNRSAKTVTLERVSDNRVFKAQPWDCIIDFE